MVKTRLLLDANISPETAIFLRSFSFNVKSLIEDGLGDIEDEEVAKIARKEKRTLVTFDLDFGEMYYFALRKKFSVIILRLEDQRVEAANAALKRFLETQHSVLISQKKKLVILTETEVRIVD